mmetsp:Transcript_17849/g.31260  ORF Transcript_17849/g.31260 Transcript_17849/m.31260 type:complete len:493 (-) Transcript_17849:207-1685(-)|eukprot:CAMPEP_0197624720 /NCGR_PEP_ID=MMETSP1338-20131121/4267_1 /TAXON_ID=43686 ORGANISM="Pelagodinium beii, Strain RCC1491" /NCGR_SAMPLE_ID=MMETSP1338 /ASSEMBLY_ACC=CAM_ASM_000754 /LENGTH=492 /DNA_ID=CAMNT_0043194915 /DNA_START=19 /DNA_END=1497 /DNA_ORIENTATION=-
MILYDNQEQLGTLLHLNGNVVYRVIPVAVAVSAVSFGFAVFYKYYEESSESFWAPLVEHPFGAQTISSAVSFALVWRTTLAWARYWDACTQSSFMYSKWSDSYTTLISFINYADKSIEGKTDAESLKKAADLKEVRNSLAHNFSLLSALCSHRLTHGDLARMRIRSEKYGMRSAYFLCGLVRLFLNRSKLFTTREDLRFEDFTGAFNLPEFRRVDVSEKGSATSRRTNRLKTVTAKVQSVSGKLKAQLKNREGEVAENTTWSSDFVVLGELTQEERDDLSVEAFEGPGSSQNLDRPTILFEWISEDINFCIKLCGIPPPIVSRCYQELSNGMLGFNQAIKVADIPFPFPFSQLLEILLRVFTSVVPLYVARFTKGLVMTPLLSLGITLALWSLSEISRELENPFADGPNQLPVIDMHERFVDLLRTVYNMPRHHSSRKKPGEGQHASVNGVSLSFDLTDVVPASEEMSKIAAEVPSFPGLTASGLRPGSLCL